MSRFDVSAYLRRLGLAAPGPPSVTALRVLHAAQVERVAYEALDVQLGRLTSIDPYESAARITAGRGGYCYHLNGAFALLLGALGYEVTWHRAGVQGRRAPKPPGPALANHLALTVRGLVAEDCPSGVWLVDAGLGDGLHEPLPLSEGEYVQGPFRFRLRRSVVAPGGWRLDHDPRGAFTGVDFGMGPAVVGEFLDRHRHLSTSPESGYVRTCTVMRRDAGGADVLTGCVLRRIGTGPDRREVLESKSAWYAVLADLFGLTLTDLDAADREVLWARVRGAHEAWSAGLGNMPETS
ncbi:arylamine N-acetyltransferase family protein [Actinoallomurus rhizosphaericola]|uniref:arylamine N-acetyltransferase family protein n=1 Tax=Actinoallomurus rhizosphaericola TaxID=2952536 RepID=UPI002091ED24|nr:arylamine N-acetyltransferase [Actinoallomurus rhizosphaericola]MCO5997962.1 arylamine N-acetyltransferase [Actinoallomurus rhizosphaericola]